MKTTIIPTVKDKEEGTEKGFAILLNGESVATAKSMKEAVKLRDEIVEENRHAS